jgi:hypothetical protein
MTKDIKHAAECTCWGCKPGHWSLSEKLILVSALLLVAAVFLVGTMGGGK